MSILHRIHQLSQINPLKTVYFNFHYLPFKDAIRMPIFIFWRSKLAKMKGNIVIDAPIHTGMIKFGLPRLGTQDFFYERTLWEGAGGMVVFKGKAEIGRGCKLSVGHKATLTLGEYFSASGKSEIICHKEITFGHHCLLSWDILVMDTDFHDIIDEDGRVINPPKPITVGNHVWVGCKVTILKGVSVAENCVISANSTITRSVDEKNCIIGGHNKSMEILRRNINWRD